jgi:hypothetical protein
MSATYQIATDEMFAQFNTAWQAQTAAIAGYVPIVYWPLITPVDVPDGSKYWTRVSKQGVLEEQTTLRDENGERRYTAYGLIFVEIYAPKSAGNAPVVARALAVVARNAYRGKTTPSKVIFRNARIKEVPEEALYYRLNVVAEYEYDEIG